MAMAGTNEGRQQGAARRRLTPLRLPRRLHVTRVTAADLAGLAALHALVVMLFIVSSASGEAAGWDRLPIDESWTRMTYIRNFSDSFSFEFTSGEASTGATSPLWTMLNGVIAAVLGISDGGLPGLAKLLGIMFGVSPARCLQLSRTSVTRSCQAPRPRSLQQCHSFPHGLSCAVTSGSQVLQQHLQLPPGRKDCCWHC